MEMGWVSRGLDGVGDGDERGGFCMRELLDGMGCELSSAKWCDMVDVF